MYRKFAMFLTVTASAAALIGCGSPATNSSNNANTMRSNSNSTMSSNANSAMNSNVAASNSNMASDNPMVGGSAMLKTKDIIDNAVNSKDHTTLVAAVKAAGLVDTLKGAGPFT
ncbi:MAG: hypothetical protein ACKVQJ_15260, partial [Pyrinomonadaceae bacterium]